MNINCKIYDITKPSKQVENILASVRKCGVGHVVFRRKTDDNPITGEKKDLYTIECISQRSLSTAEKDLITAAVSRIDAGAVKFFQSQVKQSQVKRDLVAA